MARKRWQIQLANDTAQLVPEESNDTLFPHLHLDRLCVFERRSPFFAFVQYTTLFFRAISIVVPSAQAILVSVNVGLSL